MTNYDAGAKVRLSKGLTITLGSLVNISNHPSGTQFDGPAVIVRAYHTNLGVSPEPFRVDLVSVKDSAQRVVSRSARNYADEA